MKSPIKYFGGKRYLAKRIVALMPPHKHYVEPFGGSLAVLLEHDPTGCSEIVNDLNEHLMNFWSTLADEALFLEFKRVVEATPFSEPLFNEATGNSAVDFFIRCRQSRAGCFKDFATLTRGRLRGEMNEQVSAWLTSVEGLPEVHSRLIRVLILNRDGIAMIDQQDTPDTVFYCDPPYLQETRATVGQYEENEMSTVEHEALLATLARLRGKFLLSGYRSELYDFAAKENGWSRMDFDLPNNAAGGSEKRRMTECVWTNFEPKGWKYE